MEDIKEKIPMIIAVIIAIAICGIAVYYTKIDNTRVEKISANDDMKYQYTLDCYNENGKIIELKFKTSRELRKNAYLKLEVMLLTGVHSWEEVQYNELPDKVKANYKE